MTSGIGVKALRPDLLEVVRRNEPHQRARNLAVVRIRGAPKRLTRIGMFIAGDPFTQAKLERIQIRFQVVRHLTD